MGYCTLNLCFLVCLQGSVEFRPIQVQPPGSQGKADHVWAVQNVPVVSELLEAGDTDAVPAAHAERGRDRLQGGLHQVCEWSSARQR